MSKETTNDMLRLKSDCAQTLLGKEKSTQSKLVQLQNEISDIQLVNQRQVQKLERDLQYKVEDLERKTQERKERKEGKQERRKNRRSAESAISAATLRSPSPQTALLERLPSPAWLPQPSCLRGLGDGANQADFPLKVEKPVLV